ncbi:anti-sigma factor [Chryseolinea sp. T2]|uniref:anti-sigma factor n=1 Tax=Chryseolinea sp. T2 TaxID=3129255 RepID=UPI003077F500
MNIEAYIASGVLEAYVQGQLSAAEIAEVEQNLVRYPQLRSELKAIEDTHEALLQQMAIQPKPSTRQKLLTQIQKPSTGKIVPLKSEEVINYRWVAAAAVFIALVASWFAFDYRGKWKDSQRELTDLIAQNQQVADNYNTVNERLDRLETDIKIINNPAFRRVVLKGTEQAPSALASVYWNETSKEVYLSIQEMKELSAENQYQLWAIIDGKPVDAGVFDLTKGRLLRMKDVKPGATTFAVTIEPKGGKTAPTLQTMQVAGNVIEG